MKRSVTEVIRGGFDLTVANWPLLLLRIAEHVVIAMIAIASILAIIVPIAVSAGLGHFTLDQPGDVDVRDVILGLLMQHWLLLLFVLLVITAVLVVFVALHSFVQAGCAQVYVTRALQPATGGLRARPTSFSIDRFLAGGKRGWLPVFWIYNIAWLFAGVVLLVPILPIPFLIALTGESTGSIVVGCVLLALWAFFAIMVALATALWTMKAIVVSMTRNLDARASLKEARRAIRAEPGSHFAVGFIMLVIWFGGTALIGTVSGVMSIGHATPLALLTAPLQIFVSLINAVFSSALESWFLASFISMES